MEEHIAFYLNTVATDSSKTSDVCQRIIQRNFFLWAFVKDRVFIPPLPANVVELQTGIAAAVAGVTPEMAA
jgi:hypothetical protein